MPLPTTSTLLQRKGEVPCPITCQCKFGKGGGSGDMIVQGWGGGLWVGVSGWGWGVPHNDTDMTP